MALANRVKESTTTTGTGTVSLAGADSGFQTFVSGLSDSTGDSSGPWTDTPYLIVDSSSGDWEMGRGTVTDAATDTLSRSVVSSSNSNNLVNFAAGAKAVLLAPHATDFGRDMYYVRVHITGSNEDVAGGADEQMVDFVADNDTNSLWSSDEMDSPVTGAVIFLPGFIKDDDSGTTNGVYPNFTIEGTLQLDFSNWASATAPQVGSVNGTPDMHPVTLGDTIQLWGSNPDSDTTLEVTDGSYASFLFIGGAW